MGDDGALYVSEDVVPIYKSIIPFADIILPNQFEAETLSDCKLDSLESIKMCLRTLHRRYQIRNIVISSLRLESHSDVILCCGSTATSSLEPRAFMLEAPVIDGPFVGTGDLFAALLLVRLHPFRPVEDDIAASELPLAQALELVIASMQGVLKNTKRAMDLQLEKDGESSGKERQVKLMRAAELRLVASQQALLTPEVNVKAVALE
jgi:pyridoxine kinase